MQGEIIHHNRDVAVRAIQRGRFPVHRYARGMQSSDQPLRSRFFIPGRAIDLARAIQTFEAPHLQPAIERARIHVIVFDRISGLGNPNTLETLNRVQEILLHSDRKRRADTVRIDKMRVEPFWFQEYLVPIAIPEPVDLVLDRRAISRPFRVDRPRVER